MAFLKFCKDLCSWCVSFHLWVLEVTWWCFWVFLCFCCFRQLLQIICIIPSSWTEVATLLVDHHHEVSTNPGFGIMGSRTSSSSSSFTFFYKSINSSLSSQVISGFVRSNTLAWLCVVSQSSGGQFYLQSWKLSVCLGSHSNSLGNSVQYLQHITFAKKVVPSSNFFQDAYHGNHHEFNMVVSNNYSTNRILSFWIFLNYSLFPFTNIRYFISKFENFNFSENNILSVGLAMVLARYVIFNILHLFWTGGMHCNY